MMILDAANPVDNFTRYCNNNSIVMFVNIYASKKAIANWEYIKQQPGVTVTTNFFWLALVFFKTDQAPQHFKLRFY